MIVILGSLVDECFIQASDVLLYYVRWNKRTNLSVPTFSLFFLSSLNLL